MTRPPNYEIKDIHFSRLAMLTGLLFVILGATMLLGLGLDHLFTRYLALDRKQESVLAELNQLPPEPRLQVNAAVDMVRLRDVENVLLNNYAWIDPEAGKVRIPIDRAMAIVAEREKQ